MISHKNRSFQHSRRLYKTKLSLRTIYSSVTAAEVEAEPRLMRQRMLTQRRLQVATYTTRRPEGTSRKLTAWAGIQNRHEDWNVVTNFSLRSRD